jgi:hypothetical protein
MPEGAVYVGRPSRFGNPFSVGDDAATAEEAADMFRDWLDDGEPDDEHRLDVLSGIKDLRGRDLACWCPLDQPCHADVLLKLANE